MHRDDPQLRLDPGLSPSVGSYELDESRAQAARERVIDDITLWAACRETAASRTTGLPPLAGRDRAPSRTAMPFLPSP